MNVERFVRECNRFQWRTIGVGIATVLFMAASFALVIPFRDQIKQFVSERYGLPVAEFVIGLTPFPSVIVVFAGLIWLQRHANRSSELNCPYCRKFVGGMRYLVVATKCCPHCGKRILEVTDD